MFCDCSGGDPGIRTLGGVTLAGFQVRIEEGKSLFHVKAGV